ncbi:MAG: hypothetical protein DRN03_02195 [Thermoplasmata archaeon]|nr:MAG: hypothetical protein DRN03_02195 [Thermoplasmata archaeon]
MKMKMALLILKTNKPVREDSSKLRGYVGKLFPNEVLLHHHVGKKTIYAYPRVQYKIIEGTPMIVGVEEGVDVLKMISEEMRELKLGRKKYSLKGLQINIYESNFGKCRVARNYKIVLPWLALNQENYKRFKEMKGWKEKKDLLSKILVANVLSMSKSFGYTVRGKLQAKVLTLQSLKVKYKSVHMVGFVGSFRINFNIPDYLGIGKGVSHGFGTVKGTNS